MTVKPEKAVAMLARVNAAREVLANESARQTYDAKFDAPSEQTEEQTNTDTLRKAELDRLWKMSCQQIIEGDCRGVATSLDGYFSLHDPDKNGEYPSFALWEFARACLSADDKERALRARCERFVWQIAPWHSMQATCKLIRLG